MEINLEEKLKELEKLQTDLKIKLESASNLIEELKCNKREIEKNKDFRRRMNNDESYYYIALNFNHTIEDAVDCGEQFDNYNFNNYNYFKTEQEALKYVKITKNNFKILQALEYINSDWKPDWTDGVCKYCIDIDSNYIEDEEYCGYNQILVFPTREKRQQFRELISNEEIKLFLNPLGEI